ncbi:MAG: ABC transporter ATP-binding protein [archaeon]
METIIRLDNVWKIYHLGKNPLPVLKGLHFNVFKNDFVAVMGPSGSGKSTTMNMIGCLDTPTKGHIYLKGHDISRLSESTLAQIRGRTIGFIFQQFNLIPTMTALENVMLPMIFQGIEEVERIARASFLLKQVGLEERQTHKPSELSGGEQQRVAIARALANNPEIILADEPTGNLDSKRGEEIINLLRQLHEKEGKTIVIITHDKHVAKNADRIIFLKDGMVVKSGV